MADVYTKRFFGQYMAANSTVDGSPVPAGKVWVLRDINIVSGAGTTTGSLLLIRYVQGANLRGWLSFTIDAGQKHYQWSGRLLMRETEYIECVLTAVPAAVFVTGYELGAGPIPATLPA